MASPTTESTSIGAASEKPRNDSHGDNDDALRIRHDGVVLRIELNRPAVRNAFNSALIADLMRAFADAAQSERTRVVVLSAQGSAFCAGADLAWMRGMAENTWEENRADAQALADMLWTVYSCPLPVVARIQGDCYAGGVGLVAVCDVRIAARSAQFCLSEAKLGLLPATIGPYVVRAMGASAAGRYFVSAERFDAERAAAIGLVHEVVEAQQLDATVQDIVEAIAANGPDAVKACKKLVRDVAGQDITPALRADTAQRIADIRASAEGREGVLAFLQKRPPSWRLG